MSNTHRHKKAARQKRKLEAYDDFKHTTKKHGTPLKRCNCAFCRSGAKRGRYPVVIRTLIRSHRSTTKRILKVGSEEDLTTVIHVGYTD